MKHKVSLGKSNFKRMIESKSFFVDKSLFIKEVIEESSEVVLITRPRRFGKSLNFSMLKYFFDIKEDSKELFKGLKISREKESLMHMNKYPVVDMTLKDVTGSSWGNAKDVLRVKMGKIYEKFKNDVWDCLTDKQKKIYTSIEEEEASEAHLIESLLSLTEHLKKRYGEKVIVLIDEYDAVMMNMYGKEGFEECVDFFRQFYGNALKGNDSLYKALMTGIVRVAEEGMLSGLNNVAVYTVLSERFSKHFGFLEEEIEDVLKEEGLSLEETKKYYNGYKFGNSVLYNPWSITNLLHNKKYEIYWINTGLGAMELIRKSLKVHKSVVGEELEKLIEGGTVKVKVPQGIVLEDVLKRKDSFWSLVLYSGYLTTKEKLKGVDSYELKIPNEEVKSFYTDILDYIVSEITSENIMTLLIEGKYEKFERKLNEGMLKGMSYYDEQELFYHGLVYAMSKTLNDYEVLSNVESGNGRPDIMIEGKEEGIIIEIKRAERDLKKSSKEAIEQIKEKRYWERLGKEVKKVKLVGLSFKSKEAKVLVEEIVI